MNASQCESGEKNGEVAFGILLRDMDVRIDHSVTLQNLFCRRE